MKPGIPGLYAIVLIALAVLAMAGLALVPFSCAPAHAVAESTGLTESNGPTSLPAVGLGSAEADTSERETRIALDARIDAHSFWGLDGVDQEIALDALMLDMSDEERLGQLFMLSYGGDVPTTLLYSWIRLRGIGGIKIFGWNADDTVKLGAAIAAIQDAAAQGPHNVPPFVATDQEGGWIRHVKGNTSITPGNMAIGASAWPSDSYRSALYIGTELSALGITMNFAPTVDLATRPDSTIIGSRAFSHDPMETAVLAAAWSRGMADSGVFATAKHFPGHGDTALDSHGILPVLNIDMETLWARELVPYRILVAEGLPVIMSGHLAYPLITGNREPASLSSTMINGLLRGRIGYDGVVITDDLMMHGAASPGGLAETCERAIRAGNDILMFSKTLALDDPVWTRLLALYRRDDSFKTRVDESARRVIRAKLDWLLPRGERGLYPMADPETVMRTDESRIFFFEQALRSATMLGDGAVDPDGLGSMLVAGQFADFFPEALRRFPDAEVFHFAYLPGERANTDDLASFKGKLDGVDTVLVCVANPASAEYARAVVKAGKRLLVISVLSPAAAVEFIPNGTVAAVYSYARESFTAAFAILVGEVEAVGRLPVALRP
ncbi:MAG: glycoside hydrolase family 3 N-terminal domain-containing protein [Spirochaetota bacterium]